MAKKESSASMFGKYKDQFSEISPGKWVYEAAGARLEITEPQGASVKTKLIGDE